MSSFIFTKYFVVSNLKILNHAGSSNDWLYVPQTLANRSRLKYRCFGLITGRQLDAWLWQYKKFEVASKVLCVGNKIKVSLESIFFYATVLVRAVRAFLKALWVQVLAVKVLVEVVRSLWLLHKPGDRKSATRDRESVIRGRESARKGLSDNECIVDSVGVSVVAVRLCL